MYEGSEVSIASTDPMIAKYRTHAPNREQRLT